MDRDLGPSLLYNYDLRVGATFMEGWAATACGSGARTYTDKMLLAAKSWQEVAGWAPRNGDALLTKIRKKLKELSDYAGSLQDITLIRTSLIWIWNLFRQLVLAKDLVS
ncbi:CIC11C00000002724 [Sungouiella intermedia]|uniref:CIC11C00000002724 n=1 Tax=Sungouiella intermedia TaxID=45354 RepID=A0A1L0BXG8_9ASCO|nr:CIC11C00000002724 [[Candida] intermedia]